MSYRAFWQRRCRAAAAGAVLKPSGGNCAVLPYIYKNMVTFCQTKYNPVKQADCVILDRKFWAIPHNSKCRYGERGAADAKPKAQIILDAAKVSAASGGCSEPKQGQRSQSARGFCPRSTMRVPQPDIIEHFGNADAVPQLPERCLSRKAGIVRCCLWQPGKANCPLQFSTQQRAVG